MTLYRKRQFTVEAYKWMPDHETMDFRVPLPEWLVGKASKENEYLHIFAQGESLTALPGDWVTQDKRGIVKLYSAVHFNDEFEPMKE